MKAKDPQKLDRIVAEARSAAAQRELGYREQALKIYPWICGRCGREFTHANLRELTPITRDSVVAYFEQMIASVRDPLGYAVWMVPVVSARVPVTDPGAADQRG